MAKPILLVCAETPEELERRFADTVQLLSLSVLLTERLPKRITDSLRLVVLYGEYATCDTDAAYNWAEEEGLAFRPVENPVLLEALLVSMQNYKAERIYIPKKKPRR